MFQCGKLSFLLLLSFLRLHDSYDAKTLKTDPLGMLCLIALEPDHLSKIKNNSNRFIVENLQEGPIFTSPMK